MLGSPVEIDQVASLIDPPINSQIPTFNLVRCKKDIFNNNQTIKCFIVTAF